MGATKTLLTLEEYARLPDDENGFIQELDERELINVPAPVRKHSRLQARLFSRLDRFLERNPIGEVCSEDGYIIEEDPPTVWRPDVAFLRADRARQVDPDGWVAGAPDLAVEVVSPSDSAPSVLRRVWKYLKAGSHTVWVIYPDSREVHVFETSGAVRVLQSGQSLEAPALLPGFSVALDELFA
jgi:Uma2 family endonuclease